MPSCSDLSKWTCAHRETTEPDAEGYALCLRCRGAVVVRLTRHVLDKTVEAIKRGE